MRVFFTGGGTGGHLYPALSIARALVRQDPRVRPHFIGASRGIERDVLPTTEFPYTLLDLHPLYRSAPWRNWQTAAALLRGWRAVSKLAAADPPALVVATGGYASSATLAFAALHRVPFVLQEQNAFPGQTVRLFSRWARAVFVGFPEAGLRLPASGRERVIDAGNPIDPPPESRPDRTASRAAWGFPHEVSVVALAFGGSQGSAALNALVDGWVSSGIPEGVGLIWGTGKAHHARYASRDSPQVKVRPYLAPIAEAYAAADVALTRAGAMTTAELCAWGIPMYLVPLPTAAADHQTANARALAESGAADWVAERDATPARLAAFVREVALDPVRRERLAAAALTRARPRAAQDIAHRLVRMSMTGPDSLI
ncbi:MAG: UDP-N-acetylglucosamine--N-acetylmuramyl-(pentapeptide) pyrophosphoryl-undecaprenol N-acetylglucosamine transferase [Gemmatimonadaceae bacterium]